MGRLGHFNWDKPFIGTEPFGEAGPFYWDRPFIGTGPLLGRALLLGRGRREGYPTLPSREMLRSFWASTANSIGNLLITSRA